MQNSEHIPRSFSRWDPAAKVGLGTVIVILLLVCVWGLSAVLSGDDVPAGIVPDDAAVVELPMGRLEAVEETVTPLLRGGLSPFDGIDSLNSGEAVSVLLSHLCATRAYETDGEGRYLVPAADVEELYSALFGDVPPRENISAAVYDAESELYAVSGGEYHPEYVIEIVSTYTLDDTVYVHADVTAPADPVPEESENPSEESDPADESETEEPDAAEDVTAETPDPAPSPDPSEQEPILLRSVVFTFQYTDGAHIITELRDV